MEKFPVKMQEKGLDNEREKYIDRYPSYRHDTSDIGNDLKSLEGREANCEAFINRLKEELPFAFGERKIKEGTNISTTAIGSYYYGAGDEMNLSLKFEDQKKNTYTTGFKEELNASFQPSTYPLVETILLLKKEEEESGKKLKTLYCDWLESGNEIIVGGRVSFAEIEKDILDVIYQNYPEFKDKGLDEITVLMENKNKKKSS